MPIKTIYVCPDSTEERFFEELLDKASTLEEFQKLLEESGVRLTSVQKWIFNTEQEVKAFIRGYQSAIGYDGKGSYKQF